MIQVKNYKLQVTNVTNVTLSLSAFLRFCSSALLLFCFSAFLLFSFLPLSAQRAPQKAPHEFSINAAAGVSTYAFSPKPKKSSSVGFSSDFGIGFTGFFTQQLGVHVGAGFGLCNVKSTVRELKAVSLHLRDEDFTDTRYEFYDLHTTLNKYNDIHKTLYITIPVMLHFQTVQKQYWSWKNTQKAGFYAMGGFKVMFLVDNKYETRVPTIHNAAFYPEMNNWAGTQEFKGFGTFDGNTVKGKLDFAVMATFSLEAGVKWRIENNMFFYTGVFFDCGLNDPIKDSRKSYGDFKSALDAAKFRDEVPVLKYANRANLMTVGVKLHFAFSRQQRPY